MLMSQTKSNSSEREFCHVVTPYGLCAGGTKPWTALSPSPETPFASSHLHLEAQQQKLLRKQQQTRQNNAWKDSWNPLSPVLVLAKG